MFDKVVKASASWDWVTPLIAFVQDWWYRPSTGFNLPFGYSYSAWEIKRFLQSKGVRVWGVMVIGDVITLRVREAQALYTQYWLEQLGIPYEGGLSPEVAAQYKATNKMHNSSSQEETQEEAKPGRTGITDSINEFADRIASRVSGQ